MENRYIHSRIRDLSQLHIETSYIVEISKFDLLGFGTLYNYTLELQDIFYNKFHKVRASFLDLQP